MSKYYDKAKGAAPAPGFTPLCPLVRKLSTFRTDLKRAIQIPPTISANGKLKKDTSEGKVRKISEGKQKRKAC